MLDAPPSRPLWLWTLADLALLLVGFFVLVQATDRRALAKGLREGFGATAPDVTPDPIPLAVAAVGFAPGSASIQSDAGLIDFATANLRDPRASLRVSGGATGAGDVDPATGSADLLATDRARAVTAYLIGHGIAAGRITIASASTAGRTALVTVSFTGDPAVRTNP
ncbi:OmpA family protein [Sphingomonas panacisoli]|uniref:OmpA family protein n=1 Tax=Sphingomonas panacisoli TaxID=1813879 RepID=A0A5B8LLX5_9SPHN|nr:OmpA family protein [Sphingomonas panacisoli]